MIAAKNKFLLFLIMAISFSDATRLQHRQDPSELQTYFLKNLLRKYESYHIIFHIETLTAYFIEDILQYLSTIPVGFSIWNQDKSHKKLFTGQLSKPRLHTVVISDPSRFSSYLKYHRNVSQRDVIIFLLRYTHVKIFDLNFWIMPHLERAGNVLVFDVETNLNPKLYQICFYCGPKSGHLIPTGNISKDALDIPARYLFPIVKKQMSAHLLIIGYVPYFPFAFPSEHHSNGIEGIEAHLLETVSLQLNFSYKLEKLPNYEILFEKLRSRKLDLAIGGLAWSKSRHKYVDFSDPFLHGEILAWYQPLPYFSLVTMTLFRFLMPLPSIIWVGIFSTILFISFVVYIVLSIFEDNSCSKKKKWLITLMLGVLLEQPVKLRKKPFLNNITLMIILSSWFSFCLLIDTVYKSRLTSFFMHHPPESESYVEDLLRLDYSVIFDQSSGIIIDDYLSDAEFLKLNESRRVIPVSDLCSSLHHIKHHKSFVIEEFSRIFYHSRKTCNENRLLFMFMNERVHMGQAWHGWAFKIGSPILKMINMKLRKSTEAGLITKIQRKVLKSYKMPVFHQMPAHSLRFRDCVLYFIIYGVLNIVSILVLIAEIAVNFLK